MANRINLRDSFNAISDVVTNRPRPLRIFDQIFMKTADMLLQADHVGEFFDGKNVVCIGDGDAIGLCLVHLHNQKLLEKGPRSLHVLDFDERVVLSVRSFAKKYNIEERVTSELYNVAEPMSEENWQKFDAFYTNPPFGASNDGRSVQAFVQRGIEAIGDNGLGCVVLADDKEVEWCQAVLRNVQRSVIEDGFVIHSLMPAFHLYHLDDDPGLRSCSLMIQRVEASPQIYTSCELSAEVRKDFYGDGKNLRIRYVRDATEGGLNESRDHTLDYYNGDER